MGEREQQLWISCIDRQVDCLTAAFETTVLRCKTLLDSWLRSREDHESRLQKKDAELASHRAILHAKSVRFATVVDAAVKLYASPHGAAGLTMAEAVDLAAEYARLTEKRLGGEGEGKP
jgi:hypothetical protein